MNKYIKLMMITSVAFISLTQTKIDATQGYIKERNNEKLVKINQDMSYWIRSNKSNNYTKGFTIEKLSVEKDNIIIKTQVGTNTKNLKETSNNLFVTGPSGISKIKPQQKISKLTENTNNITYKIPLTEKVSGLSYLKLSNTTNDKNTYASVELGIDTGKNINLSHKVVTIHPLKRQDRLIDWRSNDQAIIFDNQNKFNQKMVLMSKGFQNQYVIMGNEPKLGYYYNLALNHSGHGISFRPAMGLFEYERWEMDVVGYDNGHPVVQFTNIANNQVLDVPYSNYDNRTPLGTYHNNKTDNQKFVIKTLGDFQPK